MNLCYEWHEISVVAWCIPGNQVWSLGFLLCLVKVKDIILAFLCIVVCKSACSSGKESLLADLGDRGAHSETREKRVHGSDNDIKKWMNVLSIVFQVQVCFIIILCIGNMMGNCGTSFISRKALVGVHCNFFSPPVIYDKTNILGGPCLRIDHFLYQKKKVNAKFGHVTDAELEWLYQANKPDLTCGGKGGVKKPRQP